MCGRINVSDNEGVRLLLAMLGMEVWPGRDPRFNVAPTQTLDTVVWNDGPEHAKMRWGMMPAWAKPGKFTAPLINARAETIRSKPSFREHIVKHRVLVPINGFYEWHRDGKVKTPYHVSPKEHRAMLLAGIYQPAANDPGNDEPQRDQVSIVTHAANEEMAKVHHRMPVILEPEEALAWIQDSDRDTIDAMMLPASNDVLTLTHVTDYVNSSRNEGPQCLEPYAANDLFG